jgi:hypothetical protein
MPQGETGRYPCAPSVETKKLLKANPQLMGPVCAKAARSVTSVSPFIEPLGLLVRQTVCVIQPEPTEIGGRTCQIGAIF